MRRHFYMLVSHILSFVTTPRPSEEVVSSLTLPQLFELGGHTGVLPYHDTRVKALVWELKYYRHPHALELAGRCLFLFLCTLRAAERAVITKPKCCVRRRSCTRAGLCSTSRARWCAPATHHRNKGCPNTCDCTTSRAACRPPTQSWCAAALAWWSTMSLPRVPPWPRPHEPCAKRAPPRYYALRWRVRRHLYVHIAPHCIYIDTS
jgi:hypothetical protein